MQTQSNSPHPPHSAHLPHLDHPPHPPHQPPFTPFGPSASSTPSAPFGPSSPFGPSRPRGNRMSRQGHQEIDSRMHPSQKGSGCIRKNTPQKKMSERHLVTYRSQYNTPTPKKLSVKSSRSGSGPRHLLYRSDHTVTDKFSKRRTHSLKLLQLTHHR